MRILLGLGFWLVGLVSAFAGDTDRLSIIGFSKNATYFAFESYGTGDGSGLGYSEIYIVDLKKNEWVPGSPIRENLEDETTTEAIARAEAKKLAGPLLAKYAIDQPYELIAANPVTEIVADRKRIEFESYHKPYGLTTLQPGFKAENRYELKLEQFALDADPVCYSENGSRFGFSVQIKQTLSGKSIDVFKDASVPKSRRCAYEYELDRVVTTSEEYGGTQWVAIVAYYADGFEGPDRKYIAVPFTLP
jgi:predicted secreted protein